MQVYLPIAEVSVNALLILGMGGLVGFLSGLFGVGGGFLMTPLLIFIGIPPAVSVGTQANQLVAASVSGMLAHWRRGNVDVKMGLVLLAGSSVGSVVGVWLFGILKALGQIDLAINLFYLIFLGSVGALMLLESVRSMLRYRRTPGQRRKLHKHGWFHGLPFKTRFPKSRLYISALAPLAIGALGGFLTAIMGIGGGFILVPAMIYLLGMPARVVIGTSLVMILGVSAATTMVHALTTRAVDIVLAGLLLVGGVVGAQYGALLTLRIKPDLLRLALAVIILIVALRMLLGLAWHPDEIYSIEYL
jgi:uncharacterized membrane protein YfcA